MKRLSFALAVAGVLALGASQADAFITDPVASKAASGNITNAQWHGTQWVNPRCLKPHWSRRCR